MPVYVHCIYSQPISCRCSLSLFSLSNCINVFVWHNNSIRKHEYKFITTITPVWRVLSIVAVLLWLLMHTSIFHVFWCPRQTQHLRLETSFRPEDHTDWEMAPPSYDLQSWYEWTFENSLLPLTTLGNCPSANNLLAILKPLSKVSKIWTWFPSSEIRKRVGRFGNYEISNLYHRRRWQKYVILL